MFVTGIISLGINKPSLEQQDTLVGAATWCRPVYDMAVQRAVTEFQTHHTPQLFQDSHIALAAWVRLM